ncbi:MAG: response regulator [Oscillospiraceae bacterium]|nr:response regulator [Oscillospiraceae bacterium]
MANGFDEKKHILVVCDSPLVLAEIKLSLMDSYDVSIAATSAAAVSTLEKHVIAALIIHVGKNNSIPVMFAELQSVCIEKKVPPIFLSDNDDENTEANAFEAGAVDYAVRRPGNAKALLRRLNLRIEANETAAFFQNERHDRGETTGAPEKTLAGKTILVVDDVALNRDLIDGMLCEIEGLELVFAEDGDEAVEKFAETPDRYALILMDVQMPRMSGTDATMAIRESSAPNAREIPIIALTAGVEEAETASYLKAGMNDYLEKPMNYELLLKMVSRYII